MHFRSFIAAIMLGLLSFAPSAAKASDPHAPSLPSQAWSFNGPFGTYDQGSLQRGYKIYKDVCSSCHSMNLLYYRNLEGIGYEEGQIKKIASEYMVTDGPNEEGDMFERPALPSDKFKAPFVNAEAAKFANGGALPPDLSLIAKARVGGPDYVYALLTGYKNPPPHGEEVLQGQYWNTYFPGHKLSMAPPLSDGQITYEDGTPETLEQYAKDVSHFLMWASDPYMDERKKSGMKVILFLCVFAVVMYAFKKKVWADVH